MLVLCNVDNLTAERIVAPVQTVPASAFIVKILCGELNVRSAPGTQSKITAVVHKGEAYTIVATQTVGTTPWGRLKSGVGWISLLDKYVKKI